MKIDNCEYKNFKIKNYKAKFATDYDEGFSNGDKICNTYEEAKKIKAYGPIYICFEIEYDGNCK